MPDISQNNSVEYPTKVFLGLYKGDLSPASKLVNFALQHGVKNKGMEIRENGGDTFSSARPEDCTLDDKNNIVDLDGAIVCSPIINMRNVDTTNTDSTMPVVLSLGILAHNDSYNGDKIICLLAALSAKYPDGFFVHSSTIPRIEKSHLVRFSAYSFGTVNCSYGKPSWNEAGHYFFKRNAKA